MTDSLWSQKNLFMIVYGTAFILTFGVVCIAGSIHFLHKHSNQLGKVAVTGFVLFTAWFNQF